MGERGKKDSTGYKSVMFNDLLRNNSLNATAKIDLNLYLLGFKTFLCPNLNFFSHCYNFSQCNT